jgi:hypothetical protein
MRRQYPSGNKAGSMAAFTVGYLLGQHITQLFVAKADLVNGLSSILEGNVVAVEVRGEKDFYTRSSISGVRKKPGGQANPTGIPVEALTRGEVGNLKVVSKGELKMTVERRTRRGGPSGSPMLMTVVFSIERAEPAGVSIRRICGRCFREEKINNVDNS